MDDSFDWNLNIADQCAAPEEFSDSWIAAAWADRLTQDFTVALYGC